MMQSTAEDQEIRMRGFISILERDIQALLRDANRIFGGSKELTLAEVFTAPFLMHLWTLAKWGNGQMGAQGAARQDGEAAEFWDLDGGYIATCECDDGLRQGGLREGAR